MDASIRPHHRLAVILLVSGVLFASGFFASAPARPAPGRGTPPALHREEPVAAPLQDAHPGVTAAASAGDTLWFGGTTWNADSLRWEALPDSIWTFDSGVGSDFNHDDPAVNPYKDPSLHAHMEGWVGKDMTYWEAPYFRRMSAGDPRWGGSACVGQDAGLGGQYSFWAGLTQQEAQDLCWPGGQGYGNNWFLCIAKSFTYDGTGSVDWSFNHTNETEDGWDYSLVRIDTTGTGGRTDIEVDRYTGTIPASHASYTLTSGISMRSTPGPYTLKLCLQTDGVYSDEDGYYTTTCGGFAVDDVGVAGGGTNEVATFESGNDGWVQLPAGPGKGELSNLILSTDFPAPAPGPCDLADSVLAFPDPGHPAPQLDYSNLAISPWIDLERAGAANRDGRVIECSVEMGTSHDLYGDYFYCLYWKVQWYPETDPCTGRVGVSPLTWDGICRYLGTADPSCTGPLHAPARIDASGIVPAYAKEVRIALGGTCQAMLGPCPSDMAVWIDNVRFGVYDAASTGVPDGGTEVKPVVLGLAHPNPLHAGERGTIDFSLAETGPVSLTIYGLAGRRVCTLFQGTATAGSHTVAWNGRNESGQSVAAGIYLYRLRWLGGQVSRKIVIVP